MSCCAPPVIVRARPASACPSRTSQRSCGGASRTASRLSARRPASRQRSRSSQAQMSMPQVCTFNPSQDCCIPECCPPPLPKCPVGIYVERTKPIRPDRYYEPPMVPFNGLTTYRENYYLKCAPRGQSFKPESTFDPSCAKIDGLTTYTEAYTPKPTYPYRKPIWAKKAEFDPSGAKMDGISTYRNDYNGCAAERARSLKPLAQFDPPMVPFDGLTTYRENYYLKCAPRGQSFKPESTFDPSCAKLDGITTYTEAYTPKPTYPYRKPIWAKKAEFGPSGAKMDGISTYRNDYNGFEFVLPNLIALVPEEGVGAYCPELCSSSLNN